MLISFWLVLTELLTSIIGIATGQNDIIAIWSSWSWSLIQIIDLWSQCPGLTSAGAGSVDSTYTDLRRVNRGSFFWFTESTVSTAETHNKLVNRETESRVSLKASLYTRNRGMSLAWPERRQLSKLAGLVSKLTFRGAGGEWGVDRVSGGCPRLFLGDFSVDPVFKIEVSEQTCNPRPHVRDVAKRRWQ